MPWRFFIAASISLGALFPRLGAAAPAQFWLSVDGSRAGAASVATGPGVLGFPKRLHVWARPQTVGSTQMENVSLNVVSPDTTFDVDPNTIEFYNPVYASLRPRFEYVNDSYNGVIDVDNNLPAGMNRGVVGLQGFRLNATAAEGFGGGCDAADSYCDDSSGTAAWLLASFSIIPTSATGAAELYLQVGMNAMNHVGEDPDDMSALFGFESTLPEPPAYDPSIDAQWTHGDDDPDAVISLVKPGDYDADGDVDSDDYDEWRMLYGAGDSAADGNTDGATDAADYTVWRDHLPVSPGPVAAPPASALPLATPEPTGAGLAALLAVLAGAARATCEASFRRR